MTASPKTLRTRNMTAARRSLTLIRDAVLTHLDILEGGGVPESSFTASVTKYEAALTTLHTLDMLGEDGDGDPETAEVRLDDLEALVLVMTQPWALKAIGMSPEIPDDSPLSRLTRAVYPDGIVPAEPPS